MCWGSFGWTTHTCTHSSALKRGQHVFLWDAQSTEEGVKVGGNGGLHSMLLRFFYNRHSRHWNTFHSYVCWWHYTLFPVASFFNSRSICTRQERTESLAHIQVPLLSFPVSPSPCTYALVCLLVYMRGKERAVNEVQLWAFYQIQSITVCYRSVCVSQHIH